MNTANSLLYLILFLLLTEYGLRALSEYLNERSKNQPLSAEGAEIFSAEEYAKSLEYGSAKYRFEAVTSLISIVVLLSAVFFGWFAWLDEKIRAQVNSEILVSVCFAGALIVVFVLLNLPGSYYQTFVIEERFGFNKSTKKLFFQDAIKQLILSLVLGLALFAALAWIYSSLRGQFWLIAWALFFVVSLFMFAFGTRLFLPMFNKLEPLPDGDLRTAVESYCQSQGFPAMKLYVMDASKRSTKLNAFFSGMGRVKIIGLFDTLIEKLTIDETVAVLAHEVGHYKRKHIYAMFLLSNIQTLVIFSLLGWLLANPNLSKALGGQTASFHLGMLGFFLLFTPVSTLLGVVFNALSRRNEYQADQFSIETFPGAREQMRSALKKLSTDSLANLNPHPMYVALNYTHPPILERLAALEK